MAEVTLSSSTRQDPAPSAPVDLRPLTTSELIDRGFALYRAHFAGFLLLSLLAQAVPLLTQVLMTSMNLVPTMNEALDGSWATGSHLGIVFGMGLLSQLISFCFTVVITFYIADAYLGKVPSVTDSLRKLTSCAAGAVWTCLLTYVLIALVFLFPVAVLGAAYLYALNFHPFEFPAALIAGIVTVLFLIASFVPVLVVFMRLWLTVPPLALEGLSGWKAVRRSITLVRFDPGLGLLYWGEMRLSFLLLPLFVIWLLVHSLTELPMLLFYFSEAIRHGSASQFVRPPGAMAIFSQIMTYLASSLIGPLYAIATTLFYYDVRIRREGFDLEFMAKRLSGGEVVK